MLVAIHVAAFAFWCWLLWASRRSKGGGDGGPSGALAAAAAAAASFDGVRSTRDVLRAYQKSRYGKS